MRNKFLLLIIMASLIGIQWAGAEQRDKELTAVWNASKVILPSSRYTPSQTWQAQVMVFAPGLEYSDTYYNKVWGTPPTDANGKKWYEADYTLTNASKAWVQRAAPFSSDATYNGKTSYQWASAGYVGDIYLRRSFTLSSPVAGDIFLACGHDDAPAEYYINGVQVHTISDGWNNDEYLLLTTEQKALIKTDGTENIIAAHVHQNWGGAFADCGLYEADMYESEILLPNLDKGPWPCMYYYLNSNDELDALAATYWTGRCVNEDDWASGYGPFSNSQDKFLNTYWGSERLPLLVRRHFTLTAEDMSTMSSSTVTISYSYDENPKIYLNGTLLKQETGWNDNDYATYTLSYSNKTKLLKEGDNVLAVSLSAGAGGGHLDIGITKRKLYIPTGIEHVSSSTSDLSRKEEGNIYDLSGRKVADLNLTFPSGKETVGALPKGIYIINGKKVVIK